MSNLKKSNILISSVAVAVLVITTLFILSYNGVFASTDIDTRVDLRKFSRLGRIKLLDKTFDNYLTMSSTEAQATWLAKYEHARYKTGGNSSFGLYDCIHALFHWWWEKGGQMKIKSIQNIEKDLKSLVALKKAKVRRRYKDVRIGDIIVFEPRNRRTSWHLAPVTRLVNNRVCFSDMNPLTNMGLERVVLFGKKFMGNKVRIYSMSWDYWVGNALK